MAVVSHVSFFSVCFSKFSFTEQLQLHNKKQLKLGWCNNHILRPRRGQCTLCACSVKESRSSRKVKSNEELCNDIKEFTKGVGLPDGHVPSMKELTQHGRNDLAYIVRRRGYKLLKELLANSTNTEGSEIGAEKSLTSQYIIKGQDDRVNNEVENSKIEVSMVEYCSLNSDSELSSDDTYSMAVKSSSTASLEEKSFSNLENDDENSVGEEGSLSTDDFTVECSPSPGNSNRESDDHDSIQMDISTSLSTGENSSYNFEARDETETDLDGYISEATVTLRENSSGNPKNDSGLQLDGTDYDNLVDASEFLGRDASYCLVDQVQNYDKPVEEMPIMENFSSGLKVDPALNPCEYNYMPVESPVSSSLVEKVAKFIQNGDLDVLDDSSDVVLSESDVGESNELIELENATKTQLRTSEEAHSEELVDGGYTAMTMNGSALTSMQDVSSATVNPSSGIDQFSAEGLAGQIDKDLDVETSRREKQIEISHLKFMLHQKELELSRLKEQIEKEKLALSVLQTKAETEILNAQKLISEKDAELHAAEESLSGLTEVQIQYCGDGKIVEVAGSFNGWHHQIKMDLNPSSNIADSIGSRKRRWTTMLWLYPGIYEIKFIVDGHWRADPQRESVTRGTICNNILRVER